MAHWHGKIMNDKFDRLFKFMSTPDFADSDFGNVESPTGAVAVIKYSGHSEQLARQLMERGYPFVDDEFGILRELERGAYVTVTDSNGLIWAFWYSPELIDQKHLSEDLNNAEVEYDIWSDDTVG